MSGLLSFDMEMVITEGQKVDLKAIGAEARNIYTGKYAQLPDAIVELKDLEPHSGKVACNPEKARA